MNKEKTGLLIKSARLQKGYNWDFKLDMALLIICFVGVALRIVKGRIICSYLRYKQFFILNIIILLMSIVSIVVMYTGFIYWEHIVTFVSLANVFLCISYRELMGSVLTIDDAVQSIGVITISIIISTIAAITVEMFLKEYVNKQ